MRLMFLVVTLLCALLASTGRATLANTLDERTLEIADSRPVLEPACVRVALSLGAAPLHTAAGDASAAALRSFVLSKRSVNVRAWCLRNARNLVRWGQKSAYVTDLDSLEGATLTSANVYDRLVGARAAWADLNSRTGISLCRLAQPDQPANVRIAALKNSYWPTSAYVGASDLARVYARTIRRALHDRDDRIVAAGLFAYSMRYGASADATLLAYARDRNPMLRAGVFEALSDRLIVDATDSRLFAIGLRDPDIRVRSAALVALRVPTRADLRLLATFARTAPTRQDRRNARDQISAFRTFKPFI